MSRFTTSENLLDGITASRESDYLDLSMRKEISILFHGENTDDVEDPIVGDATFSVYVSNDGVNFVLYNRLTTNVVDSATQFDARVASVLVNETTPNSAVMIPVDDHFRYLKIQADLTGAVVAATIEDGGVDYEVDDEVTLDGGDGNATLTVTEVDDDGAILAFTIDDGGLEYEAGETYDVLGGSGTGATITVTEINSGTYTATVQAIDDGIN